MVGVISTPTIHLPYTYCAAFFETVLQKFKISKQNKGSYPISHPLPLRIEIAAIKGINIFLGRENLLAGLPVKMPSLPALPNQ